MTKYRGDCVLEVQGRCSLREMTLEASYYRLTVQDKCKRNNFLQVIKPVNIAGQRGFAFRCCESFGKHFILYPPDTCLRQRTFCISTHFMKLMVLKNHDITDGKP